MKWTARLLDKPRTLTAWKWLFQVHLWLGIFSGLYAIAIGVSGSVLMFREEIADAGLSQWMHVTPEPGRPYASPDEWVAAIRKAAGAPGAINLEFPESPGDAVRASIYRRNGPQRFFLNPYTAEMLGVHTRTGGALHFVEVLHSNFFLQRTGRVINGIGALCLLAMAITGIVIWWPGRKLWKRRLAIDPKARWKRINFDVHHAAGFWGLVGFSLLCVTGAWFTWPQFYRNAVGAVFPVTAQQPPPKYERTPGAPLASVTQLLDASDRAVPGRPTVRAFFPPEGAQPVRINKPTEGKPLHRTATTVILNPYTAEVLRIESWDKKTLGDKIVSWIGPLHTGNFSGLGVRIVYFVLGLTMPLLFISGFIMWWQRVVRGRWLAAGRRAASEGIGNPDERSHASA